MYPDIAEYAENMDKKNPGEVPVIRGLGQGLFDRNFDMFGRRFRRRGILRDLIGIMLISEFFRRRRRLF
jgi:hypothetical protein